MCMYMGAGLYLWLTSRTSKQKIVIFMYMYIYIVCTPISFYKLHTQTYLLLSRVPVNPIFSVLRARVP